jgi:hypothetical protein
MIGFALFVVYVGASLDAGLPHITKLFFKPHTLAKSISRTQEQLVCVSEFPENGCEQRDIEVVACTRAPDSPWNSWKCSPTYADKKGQDTRLEFYMKDIECETDSPDSCWLHYTVRPLAMYADKFEHESHRQMCNDLCGRVYSDAHVMLAFLLPIVSLLLICVGAFEVNEDGDGIHLKRSAGEGKTALE